MGGASRHGSVLTGSTSFHDWGKGEGIIMNSRPKALILDSFYGASTALQVVQCLAAAGTFEVFVASLRKDSILRHSRWVKRFYHLEAGEQGAALVEQLKSILRGCSMDVVLPVDVDFIDVLLRHGDDELRGLSALPPLPDLETFRTACNKWLLSEFLERRDLPHPRTVRFDPADPEVLQRLEQLDPPVITKLAWGGGGVEMRIFTSRQGLVGHVEQVATPENPALVQEFIEGYDVGSAVFCRDGEVLYQTIQKNISPEQHAFRPSKGIQFFHEPGIRQLVGQLMQALKWNGVAQIDLRVDAKTGRQSILEINPRFWGSVLGSQKMGLNFPEIACRLALGLSLPPPDYADGRYITAVGYVHHLRSKLLGRGSSDDFTYAESAFDQILIDPLPRAMQAVQRLKARFR